MALLEPTRLYVKPILGLMEKIEIRGMAHITGGGFYENIPRMFGSCGGFDAVVTGTGWTIPPIFGRIAAGIAGEEKTGAQAAGLELLRLDASLRKLMFNTYNMGIGFVISLSQGESRSAIEYLDAMGYPAWEIGRVEAAKGGGGALRFRDGLE
jgi:phosphoribosylformylglycinamidine cyclo-ligase